MVMGKGYVGDYSPYTYPVQTYERLTYLLSPGDPIVTWLEGAVPVLVTLAIVTYLLGLLAEVEKELGLNPVLLHRTVCYKYFLVIDSEIIILGSQHIY